MSTDVDPVQSPQAYQQMILALLGEDDAAEVQGQTSKILRELVSSAGAELRNRPAHGEWSVLELLGHLLDSELVLAARYRWVVAQDSPPLPGYDQDLWVQRLGHNDGDPAEMLDLFDAVRTANLALWRGCTESQRSRLGIHAERGPESLDLIFRLTAGHDRFHVDQIRRTLKAV